ncbi:hypothetical protein M885DRAFT_502468 [Pelagophyceae sp. CCMP2097]|nr:hypothetical protein M885DRAFT_502468 [Pelagophyceae sp. CCMP2097]
MRASVTAVAAALPPEVRGNAWFEERLDTTAAWIEQRTGILTRRILPESSSFRDLCVVAAERACGSAAGSKVDLVILATTTPEDDFGDAAFIAAALAARDLAVSGCAAFDIRSACAGGVDALLVAAKFVESGSHSRACVVAADALSRRVDWGDRATCALFGDAASAFVVELRPGAGLCGAVMRSSPSDALALPRGAVLAMRGPEVFSFAVAAATAAVADVLAAAAWPASGAKLVLHQANARILRAVRANLGIGDAELPSHVGAFGNTGAASVGLMLAHLAARGGLRAGDRVVVATFGAGLKVSAAALVWADGVHVEGVDESFFFDDQVPVAAAMDAAVPDFDDGPQRTRAAAVVFALRLALGVPVGVLDLAGGLVDSLAAMEFSARVNAGGEFDVAPTMLLEHETLESLCAAVEATRRADAARPAAAAPGLRSVESFHEVPETVSCATDSTPCAPDATLLVPDATPLSGAASSEAVGASCAVTPLQHAMLYHHAADAAGGHFVESFAWHFGGGGLDAGRLRAAVSATVRRHDALRSTFTGAPGLAAADGRFDSPTQTIVDLDPGAECFNAARGGCFEHHVAHGAGAVGRVARGQRRAVIDALERARPPLIRVALVDGDDCWLLITLHHLVADGASVRIILQTLSDAYAGAQLAAAPSWLQVSRDMRAARSGDAAFRRAVEYYARCAALAGGSGSAVDAVVERCRAASTSTAASAATRPCRGVVAPLQKMARAFARGSLGALANAAFAVACGADASERWTVSRLYGLTVATRFAQGTGDVVGPVLNTVPVLAELPASRAAAFKAAAAAIANAVGDAVRICALEPLPGLVEATRTKLEVVFDFQGGAENWSTFEGFGSAPGGTPKCALRGGALLDRAGVSLSVRCVRAGDDFVLSAVAEAEGVGPLLENVLARLAAVLRALAACVDGDDVADVPLGALRAAAAAAVTAGAAPPGALFSELADAAAADARAFAPEAARCAASAATVAAVTAAVARELGLETVGPDENLVALGLDSLRAMRAFSAAVALGAPAALSLRHLFASPTVRGVAEQADALASPGAAEVLGGAESASPFKMLEESDSTAEAYPLFGVGAAHFVGLFASSFSAEPVPPQIYWEWKFEGGLDVSRFETALDAVVSRHATLRAAVRDDGNMRVVDGARAFKVQRIGFGEAAFDEARRFMRDDAAVIGSVYEWPLFAICVTHFPANDPANGEAYSIAHVAMSLFLMDAVSDLTFRAELSQAYRKLGDASRRGEAANLFDTPPPQLSPVPASTIRTPETTEMTESRGAPES